MDLFLHGLSDQQKQSHRERLFAVTEKSLRDVASRYRTPPTGSVRYCSQYSFFVIHPQGCPQSNGKRGGCVCRVLFKFSMTHLTKGWMEDRDWLFSQLVIF